MRDRGLPDRGARRAAQGRAHRRLPDQRRRRRPSRTSPITARRRSAPDPTASASTTTAALALADDVDVLVHGGPYRAEELRLADDFGHTTIPYAIGLADASRCRALVITHHSPVRTDQALDELTRAGVGRGGAGHVRVRGSASSTHDGAVAPGRDAVDAVVVGAGPNGLAAAITLARAGRSVTVLEAAAGTRRWSAVGRADAARLRPRRLLGDPSARRVVAVLPLGADSPQHGCEFIEPEIALAHPLDGGRAGALYRSRGEDGRGFGADAEGYRRWIEPHVRNWDKLVPRSLARCSASRATRSRSVRFGIEALPPATFLGKRIFDTDEARAVFAGCAAHAFLPLSAPLTSSFGLVLAASASAVGWPMVGGGSGAARGRTGRGARVARRHGSSATVASRRCDDLPPHRAVVFDLAARQVAPIAGDELPREVPPPSREVPPRARRVQGRLGAQRTGPVGRPSSVAAPGTVHLGGTADEIAVERAGGRRRRGAGAGRTSSSRSRASPTRAGRRTDSTRCGPTATSRTAARST